MVSNASEDLPEPDKPVNTASLSRGISTSMFFRLCSRAPRIVIARVPEPALVWRFALSTSSISAFPGAWRRATLGAHGQGRPRPGADGRKLERRKNGAGFPVLAASHQRFVLQGVATRLQWQQMAAEPQRT